MVSLFWEDKMSSAKFVEPTLKDKFLSLFLILLTLAIIIFCGFFILEQYGFLLWIVIVLTSIFLFLLWHSSTRGFICKSCEHEFSISFWKDLWTASSILFMKKYLTCPSCNHKDYTTEVIKK